MRFFICNFFFFFLYQAVHCQYAYIPNRNSNTTSVINVPTNTVIATIPGDIQPQCVAINKVLNKTYIANNGSNSVSVISPCNNVIESTITGFAGLPTGLAASPDGQRLYVPIFTSNLLQVVNTATNNIIASITVGAAAVTAPEQCVVSPDNSRVYLTLFDENTVAVINTATNTVLSYYATDLRPTGVDISNDGTKLYVANQNSNTLIVYNTVTGARITTISLGPVTFVNGGAAGVVLNHANTLAYVALQDPGTVKVVDLTTNIVTNTINVGARPFGLDITPDDSRLYVSCVEADRVDVINTTTNTNILSVPVGARPYSYGKFIIKKNIDSVKINKTPLACNQFNFQGLAFVNTQPITNWFWDFGDGNTGNGQNISHTFGNGIFTIKLVVTDASGCKDSTTTIITASVQAVEAGNDSLVCAGIPFSLHSHGTGIISWSWSPAGVLNNSSLQNPVATIAATTKFYVTVTNAAGCTITDSVTYTVDTKVDAPADNSLCTGASVTLNATGANSYSWSPVTGLSNPAIANPVATPLITTKYFVTGTTAIGCVSMDSVTVTVNPLPIVNTTNDLNECLNTPVPLNTTGAVSYSWSPVTGLSNPAIANPVATPLVTTKYYVTGTGANGCTNRDSVTITIKPLPAVNTTPDTSICNSSVQLNTTGAVSYSWSPVTGLSNPLIGNPVATPPVTTKYYVTGMGVNGCTNKDSVTITLKPLPAVNTTPDTAICERINLQLNTTGAASYSWSPVTGLSNPVIANPVASPAITTKYYVTGTGANGCTNIDSVTVTIKQLPVIDTSPDSAVCKNEGYQLNTSGATSYSWSPTGGLSNPSIANPLATPTITTKYYVTGTAANGCTNVDSLTIVVNPNPVLSVTPDTTLCGTTGVQLIASGADDYSWSPITGLSNPLIANPIANPTTTTQYFVTGTDINGCSSEANVTIKLGFGTGTGLLLPGAFTPNGDGVNDCFGIKFYEGITELEFRIFNRWGENVFSTTNPITCWDGRFKGKINPGNYVYYLKAKTGCTAPLKIKGNVILIR
jgi:gliding motility-associated-like protein